MSQSSTFLTLTFRHAVVDDFYRRFSIDNKERLRVLKWLILIGIKETKKAIYEANDSSDPPISAITAAFVENIYHTKSMTPAPPPSDPKKNDKLTCELNELRDELYKVSQELTQFRRNEKKADSTVQSQTKDVLTQKKVITDPKPKIITPINKHEIINPQIESCSDDAKTVGYESSDQWQSTYPKWWPRDDDESGEYVTRRKKQSNIKRKGHIHPTRASYPRLPTADQQQKPFNMPIPAHLAAAKDHAETYGWSDTQVSQPDPPLMPEISDFKASLLKEANVEIPPSPPKASEKRKPVAFSVDMSEGPAIDMASVLTPLDDTHLFYTSDHHLDNKIISKKKSKRNNHSEMPRHVFASTVSTDSKRQKKKKKKEVASKLRAQIRRDRAEFKKKERNARKKIESIEINEKSEISLNTQRLLTQSAAERHETATVLKDAFERMDFSKSTSVSHSAIELNAESKDKKQPKPPFDKHHSRESDKDNLGLNQRISEIMTGQKEENPKIKVNYDQKNQKESSKMDDETSSSDGAITEAMKTSALLARLAESAIDFGNDSADYASKTYQTEDSSQTVAMLSEDTTEDRSMNQIINDLRSWIAETESTKNQ